VGTYAYDGTGVRSTKTVGGTTTQFSWDRSGGLPLLLQERAGTSTTSYLYGPGGLPLEQITPTGTAYWYHHDQLGSTRALTDSTGTPQATYTYDPYGNLTTSTGTVTNRIRFAGEYTDAESGLIYLRARYYDPATAQFLTHDPLADETRQAYVYASNDPLNITDPSGECILWVINIAGPCHHKSAEEKLKDKLKKAEEKIQDEALKLDSQLLQRSGHDAAAQALNKAYQIEGYITLAQKCLRQHGRAQKCGGEFLDRVAALGLADLGPCGKVLYDTIKNLTGYINNSLMTAAKALQ
jgi:RHS repeat-associated protein